MIKPVLEDEGMKFSVMFLGLCIVATCFFNDVRFEVNSGLPCNSSECFEFK